MDCLMARRGNCPPTPVPGPALEVIDLTDDSEDEEHKVILVEDDNEELIGGPMDVQVWIELFLLRDCWRC